jgi:hypothetical protein
LDAGIKAELGNALKKRADALGFLNHDEIATAARIARRTLQPVLNGSWASAPTVRTLRAVESALALNRGSLVTAFTNGDPSIITDQELASPDDPAAWLVQQLSTRGACADPDLLMVMARRLSAAVPDAAQVLEVIAAVVEEGHAADAVLLDNLETLHDGDRIVPRAAARARSRRRMVTAAYQQIPLDQPA